MSYYFTSESVSEGHPDKVADQISDALLDNFLAQDPNSKVACETLVTTGLAVLSGEVTTDAYVDVQKIARDVILKISPNGTDCFNSISPVLTNSKEAENVAANTEQSKILLLRSRLNLI